MTEAIDPALCAKKAITLLEVFGNAETVAEALTWVQLGMLIIAMRERSVDALAHEVAAATEAYVANPSEDTLAEMRQALINWRLAVAS